MIEQSTELDTLLQTEAQAIRQLLKHTAQSVIEIGTRLLRVKEATPHGSFQTWIESELGIDQKTARNFMNVATRFHDKTGIIPAMDVTALYLLASPSTPDELIEAVEQGEVAPDLASIKEAKREYTASSEGERATSQRLATKALVKQIIGLVQESKLYAEGTLNAQEVLAVVSGINDGWLIKGKRKKTLTALELLGKALQEAARAQKR